jgi:GTP-binding protein Era
MDSLGAYPSAPVMRTGTVAIIGRPNVGKSTLLNQALGVPLAAVSPVPQTTRDALLGVVQRERSQIAFVDTPGLHQPWSELGRRMNAAALGALERADQVLFMTDTTALTRNRSQTAEPSRSPDAPSPLSVPTRAGNETQAVSYASDFDLLSLLPEDALVVLVINKVDQLRDKALLLPQITSLQGARDFAAVLPVSVLHHSDVERILDVLERNLPAGDLAYDDEALTDRPMVFFVQEYIREQVLLRTNREVPHSVAVTVDSFDEDESVTRIAATVHVEKVGQRKILIGRSGRMIREVGTRARHRIEQLLDGRVYLRLFVRVTPRWRDAPRQLAELGYAPPESSMTRSVLTESLQRRKKQ